jgi:hypothetical protein
MNATYKSASDKPDCLPAGWERAFLRPVNCGRWSKQQNKVYPTTFGAARIYWRGGAGGGSLMRVSIEIKQKCKCMNVKLQLGMKLD